MKTLVERLHKLPSPTKPALGGAPIVSTIQVELAALSEYLTNPLELYDAALNLARSGDLIAWRKLINEKKAKISPPLNVW